MASNLNNRPNSRTPHTPTPTPTPTPMPTPTSASKTQNVPSTLFPSFEMLLNVPGNLARADWGRLAWPAAILITISGAAVGRCR